MGWFDSKATKENRHRQLIELARKALENLRVEPLMVGDEVVPKWLEPTSLPLEYREWIGGHVETLFSEIYNPSQHAGESKWLRKEGEEAFLEALSHVRHYLAGLPDSTRDGFRAETFERVRDELRDVVSGASDPNRLFKNFPTAEILNYHLRECEVALAWFKTEAELRIANTIRGERGGDPRLSLQSMCEVVAEAKALRARLGEQEC